MKDTGLQPLGHHPARFSLVTSIWSRFAFFFGCSASRNCGYHYFFFFLLLVIKRHSWGSLPQKQINKCIDPVNWEFSLYLFIFMSNIRWGSGAILFNLIFFFFVCFPTRISNHDRPKMPKTEWGRTNGVSPLSLRKKKIFISFFSFFPSSLLFLAISS